MRPPDLVAFVCSLIPALRGCEKPDQPVCLAVNGSPPKGIIVWNTPAPWAVALDGNECVRFGDHAVEYERRLGRLVRHGAVPAN